MKRLEKWLVKKTHLCNAKDENNGLIFICEILLYLYMYILQNASSLTLEGKMHLEVVLFSQDKQAESSAACLEEPSTLNPALALSCEEAALGREHS